MAVLNKYHHGGRVPEGAVDIMRGTPFGNPFPVGRGFQGMSRAESIGRFRVYLWERLQREPEFAAQVRALHGRDLCCCCAPLPCHGDVLVRAASWLSDVTPESPPWTPTTISRPTACPPGTHTLPT